MRSNCEMRILYASIAIISVCATLFNPGPTAVGVRSAQKPSTIESSHALNSFVRTTRAGSLESRNVIPKAQIGRHLRQFLHQIKRLSTIRITFADDNAGDEERNRSDARPNNDEQFWGSFDRDNEIAMAEVLRLDRCTDAWQLVTEKDGVTVHKQALAAGSFVSEHDAARGHKHACVKSTAILDVSPEKVFRLFADNDRVRDYNEHCATVQDIKVLPVETYEESDTGTDDAGSSNTDAFVGRQIRRWSKISHAVTPRYRPFKSRDFLSVVHYNQYSNGTAVIVNRPAYLSTHAPNEEHVRATVMLAGNILRPYGEHRNRTHVTMVAQVNPGGGADTPAAAWLINKLCAVGPPQFMRRLEAAALKGETVLNTAQAPSTLTTESFLTNMAPGLAEPSMLESGATALAFDVLDETKRLLCQTAGSALRGVGRVTNQLRQHQTFQKVHTQGHTLFRHLQRQRPALTAMQQRCVKSARTLANRITHTAAAWTNAFAERMELEMNCRHHPLVARTRPGAAVAVDGFAQTESSIDQKDPVQDPLRGVEEE